MNLTYCICLVILIKTVEPRWNQNQALQWYANYKWSVGLNYMPSYAVNQIQMWQFFNETIIDKQLNWAALIGFSKLRVFLHIKPYIYPGNLVGNFIKFLNIAKKYKFHVVPVLFDDSGKPQFHNGKQPDPIPGIHNSEWVQCPGNMGISEQVYQSYVVSILGRFSNDQTVILWDLYNKVSQGKTNKTESLILLKKIFGWARGVNTSQPLTTAFWSSDTSLFNINNYIFLQSDIITFHAYCDLNCTMYTITKLQLYRRPIICSQFMARQTYSNFITHLPIFKENWVWGFSYGFVYGRTQSYYPWWSREGDPVPSVWFNDAVYPNRTAFDKKQTDFIWEITRHPLNFER